MPAATTFSYGLCSKCADLPELLPADIREIKKEEKMVMTLVKIIVVLFIIGMVWTTVQKIYASTKIAVQMSSDPESALQIAEKSLESDAFTLDEYENQLIRIAKDTGYAGAMLKLAEFYTGKRYKNKKNEEKSKYWKEEAVKAGDFESIIDHYGFSDYDVSSGDYNEIIQNLQTAEEKAVSKEIKDGITHMKGIVYFKMGNTDAAKQLFADISLPELANESKYMTFQCLKREINAAAAEKILEELESGEFEIPADDYLWLYNSYAAKRDSEPDYESEMKYVQRYISSKDADKETANRIGADTYYHVAKALREGMKGHFQTDTLSDVEALQKAAKFGHVEALYDVGLGFWTGNGHYMRNYYKANEYLFQAALKGHKQAVNILKKHGVEGILLSSAQEDAVTYRFIDGYELKASKDIMRWLQLYYGLIYKASVVKREFMSGYSKKFQSFDELVNGIHLLYSEQVAEMLRWSVLAMMHFGIDIYDVNDIMAECGELSLLPRVPNFENGLEQIDRRASQLNIHMSYAQAARGCWSGAGIGTTIKGTVTAAAKASVAAGIMNIGSGVLHGIGDSIISAMNNSEIKGMGKKLFEDKKTKKEFADAVFSACMEIGVVVRKNIETQCNMSMTALEGCVRYGKENLAELDDRTLRAKINNNLSTRKNEYAYALLIEALRRHPLNGDIYLKILEITGKRAKSLTDNEAYEPIERYACDFGIVQ